MKKTNLICLVAIVALGLGLTSCSKKNPFTETEKVHSSCAMFDTVDCFKGFVYETNAIVANRNNLLDQYANPVGIVFYVNDNYMVRCEYKSPSGLGGLMFQTSASCAVEEVALGSSNKVTAGSGDKKITLGGINKVVKIQDDLFLFLENEEVAKKVAETLQAWQKDIAKFKPAEKPKAKSV